MKILLDECVTKHLKPYLSEHEVFKVHEMNWSGIKNGKLMALCVEHNFDVLLTIDKNLQFQQNLINYSLIVVIFNSFTSILQELVTFLPAFREQMAIFDKQNANLITR